MIKTTFKEISLKLNYDKNLNVRANIVPTISGTIQRKSIELSSEHLVENVELVDSVSSEMNPLLLNY